MREVEVKILEVNVPELRKKLPSLGAKKIFSGKVTSKPFDFPDGRLKKNNEPLRVRQIGKTVEVVHKSAPEEVKGFKIRKETETTVADFDTMCKIFENIGLEQVCHSEKIRESYRLGNIRFDIDQYPKIPAYLEVEAEDEKEVEKGVKMLGFRMDQTTASASKAILKKYGVHVNDLRF